METRANISVPLKLNTRLRFRKNSAPLKGIRTSTAEAPARMKDALKKTKVFLVDDDPMYLKALELSISSNIGSANVQTFQTGEACLQSMKQKPDIVVLDYYLNGEKPYAWNGKTILKQIKKIYPKTKVVMLSSQDSLNVAIDCIENGAYDYISKSNTSFIRINNMIKNMVDNIEVNSTFFNVIQFIVLVLMLTIIAFFLSSH